VLGDITGRKTKVTKIAFGVPLDLDQVDLDRAAFKFGFVGQISAIFGNRPVLAVTSCP
jgi:hypothetical protein